jgi:hypothetical protein
MGNGSCGGELYRDGSYVKAEYSDTDSGYSCLFWIERNVNNTGWYDESGKLSLAQNTNYNTQGYWDGSGYQAELCFQFNWGSSLGAAHCTSAM